MSESVSTWLLKDRKFKQLRLAACCKFSLDFVMLREYNYLPNVKI